jgi:hypothetical protein
MVANHSSLLHIYFFIFCRTSVDLAEHLVILSSAANPSVRQVLVEKRADSEMPVRRRPILLEKIGMSLSS